MTQEEIKRLKQFNTTPPDELALVELEEYITLLEKLNRQTRQELIRMQQYTYGKRRVASFL